MRTERSGDYHNYNRRLLRVFRCNLVPVVDVRGAMVTLRTSYVPDEESPEAEVARRAVGSYLGVGRPKPHGLRRDGGRESGIPEVVVNNIVQELKSSLISLEGRRLRGLERRRVLEKRNEDIAALVQLHRQGEEGVFIRRLDDGSFPSRRSRSVVVVDVDSGFWPVRFEFSYQLFLRALSKRGLGGVEEAVGYWDSIHVVSPET